MSESEMQAWAAQQVRLMLARVLLLCMNELQEIVRLPK